MRRPYRVRVYWTDAYGESGDRYEYTWADDPDQAARQAEASVYEDRGDGSEVWADTDQTVEVRIQDGKVVRA